METGHPKEEVRQQHVDWLHTLQDSPRLAQAGEGALLQERGSVLCSGAQQSAPQRALHELGGQDDLQRGQDEGAAVLLRQLSMAI